MLGEIAAFKDACGCFLKESVLQVQCGSSEPRQDAVLRVQVADDLGAAGVERGETREVDAWARPTVGESAEGALGLWGSASVLPKVTHLHSLLYGLSGSCT